MPPNQNHSTRRWPRVFCAWMARSCWRFLHSIFGVWLLSKGGPDTPLRTVPRDAGLDGALDRTWHAQAAAAAPPGHRHHPHRNASEAASRAAARHRSTDPSEWARSSAPELIRLYRACPFMMTRCAPGRGAVGADGGDRSPRFDTSRRGSERTPCGRSFARGSCAIDVVGSSGGGGASRRRHPGHGSQ